MLLALVAWVCVILKRFPVVELVGEPVRTHSVFVKGYETLPVRIPARA